MNTEEKTLDELIKSLYDIAPFEIAEGLKPYLKELAKTYHKNELKKIIPSNNEIKQHIEEKEGISGTYSMFVNGFFSGVSFFESKVNEQIQ